MNAHTPMLPLNIEECYDFSVLRRAVIAAHPDLYANWEAKRAAVTKASVGIKDMMIGRSENGFVVSFFDLHMEEGWNSRDLDNPENRDHIDWLSVNIPERGQIEAIEAKTEDGKLLIRDGHSRVLGIGKAMARGWACEGIKVVMVSRGTDKADHLLQQFLRNSGKRMTAIETAESFRKVLATGLSVQEIAKRISKPVAYVDNLLDLLEADPEVKAAVSTGRVSADVAAELVRVNGASEATRMVEQLVERAEADGKKKATRGTLLKVQGKVTPVKAITALKRLIDTPASEGAETIEVDREVWDQMRRLINLQGI